MLLPLSPAMLCADWEEGRRPIICRAPTPRTLCWRNAGRT